MRRAVYAQGLNFMGQLALNNQYQNVPSWSKVASLEDKGIVQMEGHMTQSFALLEDSQILHWGWVLDSLTTIRTLSFYKNNPKLCQLWQKYSIFGDTLGMRLGNDYPLLINRSLLEIDQIKKIATGGSFVMALSFSGKVYCIGENYKGQLGVGDVSYRPQFERVILPTNEKVVDIKAGFQHSMIQTESGRVYCSGRVNNSQYITDSKVIQEFHMNMKLVPIPQKISQISAGFHHSLFVSQNKTLWSCGLNNYGQCGIFEVGAPHIRQLITVDLGLDEGEEIYQIVSGKSHNLILTSQGRLIFFGATNHNQLGQEQSLGFEQSGPKQIDLPLNQDEKIVKIKAGFDTNAVFTNKGDCFIWGGEDLSQYGIQNFSKPQRLKELFANQDIFIHDVAIGYMHMLVYVNE